METPCSAGSRYAALMIEMSPKRRQVLRQAAVQPQFRPVAGRMEITAHCGHQAQLTYQDRQTADLFQRLHRSEEHTSELQSLMRISYAVFCLKKKKNKTKKH